jgi:hypothetical protein
MSPSPPAKVTDQVDRALARVDRVMRSLDERDGPVRDAARRERQRLNGDLKTRGQRIAMALAVISAMTVGVGFFMPIGMFGFLAAVLLAVTVTVLLAISPTKVRSVAAPAADLPNGEMVQQFDSYLYRTRRALPAPAQVEIDSIGTALPGLKQVLERLDPLDANAQDARRLMSLHLPQLIERYRNVPQGFRSERDGEGKSVDERLVEGLAASRTALHEISEKIARADIAALETQGRFIKSRYGEDRLEG